MDQQGHARQQHNQAKTKAFFERENFEQARELRIVRQQPLGNGKDLRKKCKRDELKPDDDRHAGHH